MKQGSADGCHNGNSRRCYRAASLEELPSVVRDVGEEVPDIESEMAGACRRSPVERLVENQRALILRSPYLERFGLAVDDPVFGNPVMLEIAPLGDAIETRRAWRNDLEA